VQGQALALARGREREGQPFGDMVKYMDGCWHCLHQGFVADQLTRSLDRLQMPTLDVYLLHNPEYFFSDAVKRGQAGNLGALRDAFYERIGRAFAQLEDEVKRGRIAWYGVSSNTFGAPLDDPEATSLDRMHAIAERISPQHHFAVVQLPANLYESGPMLTRNNAGGTMTALAYASAKSLAVLANRPLNAYKDERLIRLADGTVPAAPAPVAVQAAKVAALEARAPRKGLAWSAQLLTAAKNAHNLQQWRQIEAQVSAQFGPRLREAATALNDEQATAFQSWAAEYAEQLNVLIAALRAEAAARGRATNAALHETLNAHLPSEAVGWSLSQKAIAALVHTPGIACALVGMRRPEYVDDALGALTGPDFRTPATLYEALR
jgi:aryl-alcohol dehydrogenase-like predicted oxidoreductase